MINHKSKRSINIAGLVLLAGASMALAGCGATSSSSSTIGLSSIVSSSEDTSVSNEALVKR
ncbi:MAG: hypothetical protein NTV44_05535 [Firmicutes bacterium]|nr:hypothetical protein [Bacillota bacterium]